jgi:hypothetical protein
MKASAAITIERGADKTTTEKATFTRLGGMCPRCEGTGSVTDFDLTALYDDGLSLNEGALTIPGYSMEGWYGRIFRGCGFFDPDKPIRKYTKKELHDLLHKEPTKIKVEGINLTYEGLIPKIQKSFLSKDVDALQPHIRAFVERAVTFTTCPAAARRTTLRHGRHKPAPVLAVTKESSEAGLGVEARKAAPVDRARPWTSQPRPHGRARSCQRYPAAMPAGSLHRFFLPPTGDEVHLAVAAG